jgi:hypothetical protein
LGLSFIIAAASRAPSNGLASGPSHVRCVPSSSLIVNYRCGIGGSHGSSFKTTLKVCIVNGAPSVRLSQEMM